MRLTRRIFTRATANLFLELIFRKYSLFFVLLLRFAFFACFFCEIKNKYSDTHSTMRAGGWQEIFYSTGFRKQNYFFWPNLNKRNCTKIFTNNWLKTEWIINQKILDMKICYCLWSSEKFQTSFLEVALVHFNRKYRSWI